MRQNYTGAQFTTHTILSRSFQLSKSDINISLQYDLLYTSEMDRHLSLIM